MPAEELLMHSKNVLLVIQKADYQVVSIIIDSNHINKKLFKLLSVVTRKNELLYFFLILLTLHVKYLCYLTQFIFLNAFAITGLTSETIKKTLTFLETDNTT